MKKGKKILMIILFSVVCVLAVGAVIMLLWNWLVPPIFNGPEIGFWQALGLFALAKLIFGFGGGGGRCRKGGPHSWKHRYYEKFAAMTPEDRERFKEKMKEKWCSPRSEKGASPGNSID